MAMKIGAEDKKKVAILGALLAAVVGLVIYNVINVFGGSSASAPVVQTPAAAPVRTVPAKAASSTARPRGNAGVSHEATKVAGPMAGLDPTLHPELMAQAESIEYTGKGRNIFSMFSEPVIEPVKAPVRPEPVAPVPTGPPPPPPIDLKFFGYESHQGGKKAFLLHGEDVFIAAEGDVVNHHYKVLKIAPLSVQIEDIPYNNTQVLPLIQN
jgi:hypothetical protein